MDIPNVEIGDVEGELGVPAGVLDGPEGAIVFALMKP